ncbi:Uncharacterised protein [Mycobacterium tuberculosis]|nr:Uncharacterised protein [Mycobacterium tuberculosis]
MPGRFREGTETCIRKVRTLETLPTCRQTQNPERGRKLEIQHHIRSCGMLPKSSDPKPREGTETPRGWRMRCARKCRQTQNPERGRKHFERELVHSPPFRSSDPKPREGTETRGTVPPGPAPSGSSDPKPREGTETRKRSTSLTILFSRRQTQNPERGRKRISPATPQPRYCSMSSDPKPREGTETLMVGHGRARLSGSSDPKPREGTETGRRIAPGAGGAAVVRPKTPRGDGNTPPMTAMSE